MRLMEAIVEANHRALAGDAQAGLRPADFTADLPLVALTCVDPRLNPLLPGVLGVPEDLFIWLRNAGNIITSPLSSTMRSLALACAVKGGREVCILGHTDCQVRKTGTGQLLDLLAALGVQRHLLPANVNEYFGVFGSETQNVIKGVEITRSSPLIGPKVPVHGLLVDIATGKLEWLVNGYQAIEVPFSTATEVSHSIGQGADAFKPLADFALGELKFPEAKIGEFATRAEDWLVDKAGELISPAQTPAAKAPTALPPKLPLPPPVKPKIQLKKTPR